MGRKKTGLARNRKSKADPRDKVDSTPLPDGPVRDDFEYVPRGMRSIMKFKADIKKKQAEKRAAKIEAAKAPAAAGDGDVVAAANNGLEKEKKAAAAQKRKQNKQKHGSNLTSSQQIEKVSDMKIRKKESLAAFSRRVDKQAADVLATQTKKGTARVAKRKAWSEAKRDKKKAVREDRANRIEEAAGWVKEEDADPMFQEDEPEFGEVAMEPPRLQFKSRRAESQMKREPLLLMSQIKKKKAAAASGVAPIRQQTLDAERKRAIAAYREMKVRNKAARRAEAEE